MPAAARGLQFELLQPAVESAAAESQCLGSAADIAFKARKGLLYQQTFHFFQSHVLNAARCALEPASTRGPPPG